MWLVARKLANFRTRVPMNMKRKRAVGLILWLVFIFATPAPHIRGVGEEERDNVLACR